MRKSKCRSLLVARDLGGAGPCERGRGTARGRKHTAQSTRRLRQLPVQLRYRGSPGGHQRPLGSGRCVRQQAGRLHHHGYRRPPATRRVRCRPARIPRHREHQRARNRRQRPGQRGLQLALRRRHRWTRRRQTRRGRGVHGPHRQGFSSVRQASAQGDPCARQVSLPCEGFDARRPRGTEPVPGALVSRPVWAAYRCQQKLLQLLLRLRGSTTGATCPMRCCSLA
ncbi:unnamed protein product [Ixodes persulcatus]